MMPQSLTEMAKIPLFKVVLVAALTNLGSLLGTVLYFLFVFPVLGIDPGVVISTGIQNMWTWITHLYLFFLKYCEDVEMFSLC